MFYCEAGHMTESGTKRVLVPVLQRPTEDRHLHGFRPSTKEFVFARSGEGQETVKEEAFCPEHAAEIVPIEMGPKVLRIHHHIGRVHQRRH